MRFAEVLGRVNTRIILALLYYLVITPVGHRAPLAAAIRSTARMRDGRPLGVGETAARARRSGALSPAVLMATTILGHLGLLPRLGRVPGARRRDRRRRAGGALHAQEARRRRSRRTRSRTASRGRASALDDARLRRLLRQAAAQVRAAARDLSRRRAARAAARSSTAMPLWLQGEALHPRRRSCSELDGYERRRCSSPSTTSRTPRARSIPSPFDEAAILTIDGVGEWATSSFGVGRGQRPRAARRAALPALARACSTRRSPTTPASRSTPASTR